MKQKTFFTHALLLLIAMLLPVHGSFAAGAMNVDDADLLGENKCQLETWNTFNRGSTERWLNPSCNLTGNLEVSWGNAWQRDGRGLFLSGSQLQAKTLFQKLDPNGYGMGLLVGAGKQIDSDDEVRQRSWNYFAKLLTTFSFRDNDVLLHTNLGFNRIGKDKTTQLTWGIGNETVLTEKLTFIAEVFGANKGKPSYHGGIRTILIPEYVEMDLTYGNTFGVETKDRFVVLGLRFISPEF